MAYNELNEVARLWEISDGGQVGYIIGMGSDGCSLRRAVMAERALRRSSTYAIEHPSFVFGYKYSNSCTVTIDFQDWRHVLKRLVNHLRQTVRQLQVGSHCITLDVLEVELESIESGLRLADILRTDRQSVNSAQRVAMLSVRYLILEMIDRGHSYSGLLWYLQIVAEYIDIFASNHHSWRQRVEKASYVAHSLIVWKAAVKRSNVLNVKEHFLTNQTFVDVLISCMSVLNLLSFAVAKGVRTVQLEDTGSDSCESTFMKLGSQQIAQRSFTHMDAIRTIGRLNAVFVMLTEGRVRDGRVHSKRDIIWGKNYPDYPKSPLQLELDVHCTSETLLGHWEIGLQCALEDLQQLGVDQPKEANSTKSAFTCTQTLAQSIMKWNSGEAEHEVCAEIEYDEADDIQGPPQDFNEGVATADLASFDLVSSSSPPSSSAAAATTPTTPIPSRDNKGHIKTVVYQGKHYNVHLLVSVLNHNNGATHIASDRLVRVQTRYNDVVRKLDRSAIIENMRVVYAGAEVATIVEDDDGPRCYIGTIFRIVNRNTKPKRILSSYDLSTERDAGDHGPIVLIKYKKPLRDCWYRFTETDQSDYVSEVVVASVLFRVNLDYCEAGVAVIDKTSQRLILEELGEMDVAPRTPPRKKRALARSSGDTLELDVSDDEVDLACVEKHETRSGRKVNRCYIQMLNQ